MEVILKRFNLFSLAFKRLILEERANAIVNDESHMYQWIIELKDKPLEYFMNDQMYKTLLIVWDPLNIYDQNDYLLRINDWDMAFVEYPSNERKSKFEMFMRDTLGFPKEVTDIHHTTNGYSPEWNICHVLEKPPQKQKVLPIVRWIIKSGWLMTMKKPYSEILAEIEEEEREKRLEENVYLSEIE